MNHYFSMKTLAHTSFTFIVNETHCHAFTLTLYNEHFLLFT